MGKFADALKKPGLHIIGEIKKASPAAGKIFQDGGYAPYIFAKHYERNGASALSVVTAGGKFEGKIEDLKEVSELTELPVLCKDFITNPIQITQAYLHGASAVLLIDRLLNENLFDLLLFTALGLGLDVVVEVHQARELENVQRYETEASCVGSLLIGINNRNLATQKVDLSVTENIAPLVEKNRIVISESGIKTRADIERLQAAGVNRFLLGEAVLASGNFEKKMNELRGIG